MEWYHIVLFIFLALLLLVKIWKFFKVIIFGKEDDVKKYIETFDDDIDIDID
ncbi:hypothetical protein [Tenacibaculum agarivorans]|uniref:hypothetical protein n=1 Tax=Tenacibaculum agarivorans TaxID=1908389 RepID=UPI000A5B70E3|nr:hypothetical protein [Tenacibaculum agarivorans]